MIEDLIVQLRGEATRKGWCGTEPSTIATSKKKAEAEATHR